MSHVLYIYYVTYSPEDKILEFWDFWQKVRLPNDIDDKVNRSEGELLYGHWCLKIMEVYNGGV